MRRDRDRARRRAALTLLSAVLLATACAEPSGPAPGRAILANVHPEGYPTARGLRVFQEQVEQLTEGRISIDLQLAGTLGGEQEVLEKLRFGGIQMACASVAPLAAFSGPIGVLTLPYLFQDAEHMWSVLEGEIGGELFDYLEKDGFVGLAWYDAGARSFYNRERPIRSPADLVGLKIRVQRSAIMRDTVRALGATPVSIGFKQVYTNLHTGAIDGAENNLPSYRSERHFEVASYYSEDRHSMIPDLLLANRSFWESLSDRDKKALRQAARVSSSQQRRFWREYEEATRAELLAAGCEINQIDNPQEFWLAVQSVYDRHAPGFGELPERIQSIM